MVGITILLVIGLRTGVAALDQGNASEQRLITIHEGGSERSIITTKDTLRDVFSEIGEVIDPNDVVEPSLDAPLVGPDYHVNVYRARPVTIIDETQQIRIMTAHQTPKQIAAAAGVELHDEDKATVQLSQNIVADGASLEMKISRATPIQLSLYGKEDTVYTQATTVNGFLKEKSITLGPDDTLSVDRSTQLTPNMRLEIWRNGTQTVTNEEEIAFPIEQIQDVNQETGYRRVQTAGTPGKKMVTYEITMKNGQEVSRVAIQQVVVAEPQRQVEVVGAKAGFSGDFAAALARLRSCEGSYTSWNPAGPYYGAYQFGQGTWNGVADPAKYGNATPAEQDAAAYALYQRRGWQPWPSCSKKLGLQDIYR